MGKENYGRGRAAELIPAFGTKKTYAQWAKTCGVPASTLRQRTHVGKTLEEAMYPTPPKSRAFGFNVPIKHNFF